jgi:hypothetical protein
VQQEGGPRNAGYAEEQMEAALFRITQLEEEVQKEAWEGSIQVWCCVCLCVCVYVCAFGMLVRVRVSVCACVCVWMCVCVCVCV